MSNARLESREARKKLAPRKKPYERRLTPGLYLGYYRGTGSWIVRRLIAGTKDYKSDTIGRADDDLPSDGLKILSFAEAAKKAMDSTGDDGRPLPADAARLVTVECALEHYSKAYAAERDPLAAKEQLRKIAVVQGSPLLRGRLIAELTTAEIEAWHRSLVTAGPRRANGRKGTTVEKSRPSAGDENYSEYLRRRKVTANSFLVVLKAALNRSFRLGQIESCSAWQRVRPFAGVNEPRVRLLSRDEVSRFLKACGPSFRPLAEAAVLTGARWGELIKLHVGDYSPDARTIVLPASVTKSKKQRAVPLNDAGVKFFDALTAGRAANEVLFLKPGGTAWVRSEQGPHVSRACKEAKIVPAISFHLLRHAYGSLLTEAGAPLQVVSELLGHSDVRLTTRHYSHISPSFKATVVQQSLPDFGIDEPKVVPISRGKRVNG